MISTPVPKILGITTSPISTGASIRASLMAAMQSNSFSFGRGAAAHTPVGRGSTVRRVHLQDPALPRLLERGGAVADFGWDKQGLVLSVRRME